MSADDLDRRLVELLVEDGRRAYTEMAAIVGVSEATVRTRVSRLTSSGILRIVALCNPLTLGHQSVRLMLSVQGLRPRQVARSLASNPMIGHVSLTSGAHDIYLEATARDLTQLVELLDELRRTPGVTTIDQYVLTRLYKDYSWNGLRDQSGQRAVGGSAGAAGTTGAVTTQTGAIRQTDAAGSNGRPGHGSPTTDTRL
ncbi:Lrp/AsnC family transcriptional regulator [Microbacterium sp. JC 701]|uniref:Lrp/AsnC family transcriptional regulator n=1 Tax=Microbacterium sp. JC 701 TaxID=2897389 RepID=UPI001E3ACB3A|nr:Lrp/AsnC family transcriptional regulator [Microbacterium sp. JC 701]MCD2168977.1 Lrp/AsnC family transcriptional regulator [Microbacterium sp. JC 701]